MWIGGIGAQENAMADDAPGKNAVSVQISVRIASRALGRFGTVVLARLFLLDRFVIDGALSVKDPEIDAEIYTLHGRIYFHRALTERCRSLHFFYINFRKFIVITFDRLLKKVFMFLRWADISK